MSIEIKVPTLGESVAEATVARWFKKPGDAVKQDEPLCELETDKVTVEVPSPATGVLGDDQRRARRDGDARRRARHRSTKERQLPLRLRLQRRLQPRRDAGSQARCAAAACAPPRCRPRRPRARSSRRRAIAAADVAGSGKRGQVLKGDAIAAQRRAARSPPSRADGLRRRRLAPRPHARALARQRRRARGARADDAPAPDHRAAPQGSAEHRGDADDVERRRHERGDEAALRSTRTSSRSATACKLGFMGFFVKACIQALKEIPAVNAEIDGTDIVYKNYYHVGVAVGTDKGLVVPVVREADRMGLAEIEGAITDFGRRARDGKLGIDEMQGGTFTISNGGVYGSMMSMPILNAPQSGILGMHQIEERPGRARRPGRDPADDVSGAELRPPHRRRQGGGDVPRPREGVPGRPAAVRAGALRGAWYPDRLTDGHYRRAAADDGRRQRRFSLPGPAGEEPAGRRARSEVGPSAAGERCRRHASRQVTARAAIRSCRADRLGISVAPAAVRADQLG